MGVPCHRRHAIGAATALCALLVAVLTVAAGATTKESGARGASSSAVRLAHVDPHTGDLVPDLDGLKRLSGVKQVCPSVCLCVLVRARQCQ